MKACSCVRGGGRLAAYGLAACWGGPNSSTCERFFLRGHAASARHRSHLRAVRAPERGSAERRPRWPRCDPGACARIRSCIYALYQGRLLPRGLYRVAVDVI